jgi:hypothetical protein
MQADTAVNIPRMDEDIINEVCEWNRGREGKGDGENPGSRKGGGRD